MNKDPKLRIAASDHREVSDPIGRSKWPIALLRKTFRAFLKKTLEAFLDVMLKNEDEMGLMCIEDKRLEELARKYSTRLKVKVPIAQEFAYINLKNNKYFNTYDDPIIAIYHLYGEIIIALYISNTGIHPVTLDSVLLPEWGNIDGLVEAIETEIKAFLALHQ